MYNMWQINALSFVPLLFSLIAQSTFPFFPKSPILFCILKAYKMAQRQNKNMFMSRTEEAFCYSLFFFFSFLEGYIMIEEA